MGPQRVRHDWATELNWTELNLNYGASQVALTIKKPPANTADIEARVRSLGQKDPLKEGVAIHSSILAWRIHEQKSLVGYGPQGRKESDTIEAT